MAEAVEKQYAWIRPLAAFVAAGALLALVTALAADTDTIEGWLGLRDNAPVSLSLEIGKLVRLDDTHVVVAISYKKTGPAPLHDCKFWMDTGQLQLFGEMTELQMPPGPSTRDLQIPFRLGALWAHDFPDASLTLACDKASSVPARFNVANLPVGKP
jgi:hypothetical protein